MFDTPKHGDLIYDVGLHRGEDAEFYLRKGFRVVAFEANPDLIQTCQEQFSDSIRAGRMTIVEGAIVDAETLKSSGGKVRFYRNDSGTTWGTVRGEWAERNERQGTPSTMIEVEAVDFEAVLQSKGIPHYMKIDIEGCDLVCLNSLRKFRERPDYVSFESDKTSFAAIQKEIDLLTELGYDAFKAVEQTDIPELQIPPNPPREGSYAAQKFVRGSSGLFGAELNGEWRSRGDILGLYRVIRWGYHLLGDDGIMYRWQFPGAGRLRRMTKAWLARKTQAQVPGWYDTHARLASVRVANA